MLYESSCYRIYNFKTYPEKNILLMQNFKETN